jgi:UDP-glucose 4-epimerase
MFQDSTVLITGGTGSFGHALLDRFLQTNEPFGEIRIFSRDELKQEQMRIRLSNSRVKFYIGDVRDRQSVDNAMKGVNYVFHAAALKQVPSCEFFPMQAVMTNVVGSSNVVESAIAHGVSRVVALSTDKAVYPVNTMGMSKALMEKVAQAAARSVDSQKTVICSVRYGNVMSSRGSVIPLFIEQIKKNAPMTVTVPEMTRFLLRLEDAIDLVLFAFEHGNAGDILIKKAPASTIGDLARALNQLFGTSVPMKIIGTRHGEKMFETLATREELRRGEDHGDYYRVCLDDRDLNYGKYFTEGDMEAEKVNDYTSDNTERLTLQQVGDLLMSVDAVRKELRKAGRAAEAAETR